MANQPMMLCIVCRFWVACDSIYQVNVPDHWVTEKNEQKKCKGSRRSPLQKRHFPK